MRLLDKAIALSGDKFVRDLIWNYGALVVLGISGLVSSLIVAAHYGAEVLGVFNQIYSVYIVASQFATASLHYSVLKYVAEHAEVRDTRAAIVWAGLWLAAGLGAAITLAVYLLASAIGAVMDSAAVGQGVSIAALGLLFFSINKVLFAALNGLRRMTVFAIGNSLRFVFMVGFVSFAVVADLPGYALGGTFLFAEVALLPILLLTLLPDIGLVTGRMLNGWIRMHAVFGAKGFLGSIFMAINSRIDILMLGFFLSDRAVGIYSFAAMLAGGFLYLLVVVRNNVNPMLVPLLVAKSTDKLIALVHKVRRYVYLSILALSVAVLALFPAFVAVAFASSPFMDSWPILAILMLGIVIYSGYMPFDAILNQAGMPGRQTAFMSLGLGTNVLLNVLLIPTLGASGAAIATTASLIVQLAGLKLMVRKYLGVRI